MGLDQSPEMLDEARRRVPAAGGLGRDLAEGRDRHRVTHPGAILDRIRVRVECEPAPGVVVRRERAEVHARAGVRLGGEDRRQLLPGSLIATCRRRNPLQLGGEAHRAKHRLPPLQAVSARKRHARRLFAPLGATYDRYASLLSFGQDPRWRRFLISRVAVGPGDTVLDVATGTAAVAIELVRRTGCSVVGLDQSPEMLAAARARIRGAGLEARIRLVEGEAERLPFPDESFAALTFTYLLRYVDDPAEALRELARVVQPGGTVAALEFGLPSGLWRAAWEVYVRVLLPLAGRAVSPGWHDVGRFLGPSIRDFNERLPPARQLDLWRGAGIEDVRAKRLSLGGGVVTWGRKA